MSEINANEIATSTTVTENPEDQQSGKTKIPFEKMLPNELLSRIIEVVCEDAIHPSDLHRTCDEMILSLKNRHMHKMITQFRSDHAVYRNPETYDSVTESISENTRHIYLDYPPSELSKLEDLKNKLETLSNNEIRLSNVKITLGKCFQHALLDIRWEDESHRETCKLRKNPDLSLNTKRKYVYPGDMIPCMAELLTLPNIQELMLYQHTELVPSSKARKLNSAMMDICSEELGRTMLTHNVIFVSSGTSGSYLGLLGEPKEVTVVYSSTNSTPKMYGHDYRTGLTYHPSVTIWNFADTNGNKMKPIDPILDENDKEDNLDEHGNVGVLSGPQETWNESSEREFWNHSAEYRERVGELKFMDASEAVVL